MSNDVIVLAATAAIIGFTHTVLGPDHYLPFIVLSKARQWRHRKTAIVTFLCGVGHVGSSVALGFLGVSLGLALFSLEAIESFRGSVAAWLLLIFGFTYFVWGVHRAVRARRHEHSHVHASQETHSHVHSHISDHSHLHGTDTKSLTPWVLFIMFVFGPCEPLIPLLIYPAAKHNMVAVGAVAAVFSAVTISTMLLIVMTSSYGLSRLQLKPLQKYSHALAGLAIMLCGVGTTFLGL